VSRSLHVRRRAEDLREVIIGEERLLPFLHQLADLETKLAKVRLGGPHSSVLRDLGPVSADGLADLADLGEAGDVHTLFGGQGLELLASELVEVIPLGLVLVILSGLLFSGLVGLLGGLLLGLLGRLDLLLLQVRETSLLLLLHLPQMEPRVVADHAPAGIEEGHDVTHGCCPFVGVGWGSGGGRSPTTYPLLPGQTEAAS